MLPLLLLVAGMLTPPTCAFKAGCVACVQLASAVAFAPPRVPGLCSILCSAIGNPIRSMWASKKRQRARDPARENSVHVWKMVLSGRQQFYLEQEQKWEREAQCPMAITGSKELQDINQKCAHCSCALPTSPLQCGKCSSQSLSYCTSKCHEEAWRTHKFSCSDKVLVKRSAMGDGMGVLALRAFPVGEELIREAPLVVLADSQVCRMPQCSL